MGMDGCYDYVVEPRDVDLTGRAAFVALGNYVLHAAGEDADRKGFGLRDLNCSNCSWVLSRVAMEFDRWLTQYERFSVRTWVNEVGRLMTTRNMVLTDERGERRGAAVTQWAMIDLDRRTPVDIRANLDYAAAIREEPSPIEKPQRILRVTPVRTVAHRVSYSDIDFNRHANSMKYMEWMFDLLPLEYITERTLARVDINYHHEARYGELLTICFEDGPQSLFEIKNSEGVPICRASLGWRER